MSGSATATLTGVRELPPAKLSKDLRPIEFVAHDKTYRVVLQIGPNVAWRSHRATPGQHGWKNIKDTALVGRNNSQPTGDFVPAVQETDPIMGTTVNGLIQMHNDWLVKNKEHEWPKGLLNYMFTILDVRKTDEPPVDLPVDNRMTAENISVIAASVAKTVMDQMMKARGEK
jgi:hypothetical protein